jgi:pimeloyl-ACP methyl ester carboxylesterase
MIRYLCIFLSLLALSSCEKLLLKPDYREGEFFYLENNKAIMPVWVKGNLESGIFVVYLHGGPGLTSNTYANSPAYKKLQERYAFVFWDQRTSGASQGNPPKESLTLNQYVEDTEKLIQLIRHRYAIEKVFLIGKSWGGGLGTAYLLNTENQKNIYGWIEIDGAHNLRDGVSLAQEWVINKAQEKITMGIDVGYWEAEIRWYYSNPEINTSYQMRHGRNLNKLNGIYLDPGDDPGNGFPLLSPIPQLYMFNALVVNNNMDVADLWLTPEMHMIEVPSMILWGRHDGTLPVELAYDAYDHLGTEDSHKELHIFENSAHGCSFEEPELFIQRVTDFIEKYK